MKIEKDITKQYRKNKVYLDWQHLLLYAMGALMGIFIILMFTVQTVRMSAWLILIIGFPGYIGTMLGFIPMMKEKSPIFDAAGVGVKDSLHQTKAPYDFPIVTNKGTQWWNIYLGGGYTAFGFSVKGHSLILVPKDDVIEYGQSVMTYNRGTLVSISELPTTMQREIVSRVDSFDANKKILYLPLAPRIDLIEKFKYLYGYENAEFSVYDMQARELASHSHSSFMSRANEEERDQMHTFRRKKYYTEKNDTNEVKEEKFNA